MADFSRRMRGGGIGFTSMAIEDMWAWANRTVPILNDLWQLDPATLTWTRMANIPRGRYSTVCDGIWSLCLYDNRSAKLLWQCRCMAI